MMVAVTALNTPPERTRLRVLLANESEDGLAETASALTDLGHLVVARTSDVAGVGELSTRQDTDIAVVSLGPNVEHALSLIERIVRSAACPVVALIHAPNADYVSEACRRGVFAVVTDREPREWQSALEVVLWRFAAQQDLQAAFGRRATIERANGILMERHSVDGEAAFAMLRSHARNGNHKLVDVASAVNAGQALLPQQPR